MDVCLLGSDECSRTDAAGAYRLENVPANGEVMLVLTHPDSLGRMLLQSVTGAVDREQNLYFTSIAHMTAYLASSGCGGVPEAGTRALFIGAPPGAKVVVTPAPPMAPVYAGIDGFFDAALSAIPADTPATLAGAVTCGVPPGIYEIDVVGAPDTCHMVDGWPPADHDVRIVIEADTHSIFNRVCEA